MRSWVNFHWSTQKSEKFYANRLFLSKTYNVSVKLKFHTIFKGKVTHSLKNDTGNLVNFHDNIRKSENLHFDRILLSKAYTNLDEKIQLCLMTLKSDAKFEKKTDS